MQTLSSAALAATVALGSVWVAQLSAQSTPTPLVVTSTAFASGGRIPKDHVAVPGSKNLSPPLSWTGAPAAAREFAVIVEDYHAINPIRPGRTLVMWVVYGIPATATGLTRGMKPGSVKSGPLAGTIQGLSDFEFMRALHGPSGGGVVPPSERAQFSQPGGWLEPMGQRSSTRVPANYTHPFIDPVFDIKFEPGYHAGSAEPLKVTHSITFTVYAIDAVLGLPEGLDSRRLLAAIDSHIVGKGELTGIFRR